MTDSEKIQQLQSVVDDLIEYVILINTAVVTQSDSSWIESRLSSLQKDLMGGV